jgi:hypothetical protein
MDKVSVEHVGFFSQNNCLNTEEKQGYYLQIWFGKK